VGDPNKPRRRKVLSALYGSSESIEVTFFKKAVKEHGPRKSLLRGEKREEKSAILINKREAQKPFQVPGTPLCTEGKESRNQ